MIGKHSRTHLAMPFLLALAMLTACADSSGPRLTGDRPTGPEARIDLVLDDFHDAAWRADEDRYFAHFAPEGVFLGTDASERWTVEEFREWAAPYFQRESAWRYTPIERHIDIAPSGQVAWFDEHLRNARLGLTRGSGALRLVNGEWRITQYNLTIPVPNEIADEVVRLIETVE